MMSQEDAGTITAHTRVTVGQLVVAMKQMKQPSRYLASNVVLDHYREQAVEALLLHLDEQGQPLRKLLPLLPASLVDSEVCRVVWRGQTIAISLHQGLDEELAYLQCVTAIRYWMMEHPDLRKLIVSQEAREVVIVDPMPLTQLQHRPKETRSDE